MQVYFNYGGDTFGPYPAAQALEIARSGALPEDARIYLPPATWGDVAVFVAGAEAEGAPHDEVAAVPPPPPPPPAPPPPVVEPQAEPDPWAAMSEQQAPSEASSVLPMEPEAAVEPTSSASRLLPILLGVLALVVFGAGAFLATRSVIGFGVAAIGLVGALAAGIWTVRAGRVPTTAKEEPISELAGVPEAALPPPAGPPVVPAVATPTADPLAAVSQPVAEVVPEQPNAGPSTLLVVLLAVLCLVLAVAGAYLVISVSAIGYALIGLGLLGVIGLLLWLRRART